MLKIARIPLILTAFFSLFATTSLYAQRPIDAEPSKPQSSPPPKPTARPKNDSVSVIDAAAVEAQRRIFAVSLITTLAYEARSYKDMPLRSRVLARSADALWDTDADAARSLFRRAWEAAETADAAEASAAPRKDGPPVMVIALRKIMGSDSRSEVLNLAARRDRSLGEEFLAKLKAETERADTASETSSDSWTTSDETSKRLRLAHRLLDENEIDRAFQFAAPVLTEVNEKTISFLSKLRIKKPELADRQFMLMLRRAEMDPRSDANTVSGLSSYAFTPGFYVTFAADGGARWAPAVDQITAPDLPSEVRNRFFQVAGAILLRPSPPSDQDFTSSGRLGRYLVIKRLLPLFETHAPDTAAALRAQLTALADAGLKGFVRDESALMTQGIKQEPTSGDILDQLQERITKAKTEQEVYASYSDAAQALAKVGDLRAQDIADKIENTRLREVARQYVDLSLIQVAIRKRDIATAARLARSDSFTNAQRTWAYTQVAQLLMNTDRTRALETLEQALAEARRVDLDEDKRAPLMFGIASQFVRGDSVRAWEVANEAIKDANAFEGYSGEDPGLNVALMTRSGVKILELDMSGCNLAGLVRSLAKVDFTRSTDLVKSFKYEAPRAVATLAVATAVLRPDATK